MPQEQTNEQHRVGEDWWENMQRRQTYVDSIWNLDWEQELKPIVFEYLDTQPERFLVGFYSGGGDSGGLDDIFYTHVDLSEEQDLDTEDINWLVRLSLDETEYPNQNAHDELVKKYGTSRSFEIKPYDFDLDDPENPLQYVSIATMIPQAKLHNTWADGGGYHAKGAIIWDKVKRTCRLVETEELTEYNQIIEEY